MIERWSRHPELEDYASALEEWDDKVADAWIPPENLLLDPSDWLAQHKYYKDIHKIIGKLMN